MNVHRSADVAQRLQVEVVETERGFGRIEILFGRPIVVGGAEAERLVRLDAQGRVGANGHRAAIELPDLEAAPGGSGPPVPLGDLGDLVERVALRHGAEELHVFRVGPDERRRGLGRFPEEEVEVGPVGLIPDLLGEEAGGRGDLFERADVRGGVPAPIEFVHPPFAGQDRPDAPDPEADVRAAGGGLSVSVVVDRCQRSPFGVVI